jgi:hypothetical protein
MRKRRSWAIGCVAAALLLLAVSTATATRLEFPKGERNFRVTWSSLELGTELGVWARCAVTLDGSFHSRTISKVAGALIGVVTRTTLTGCSATVLTETLPWHVAYGGFVGTLPTISSMTMSLASVSINVRSLLTCLVRTTSTNPLKLIAETAVWAEELEQPGGGYIFSSMRADERATIPLSGACTGLNGRVAGRGTPTQLGSTAKVRMSLTGLRGSFSTRKEAGRTSERIGILLRNAEAMGGLRQRIMTLSLGGSEPELFVVEDPDNCIPKTLQPGESCLVIANNQGNMGAEMEAVFRVNGVDWPVTVP